MWLRKKETAVKQKPALRFADHCFMSHTVKPFLSEIVIVDSGISNVSDHKPFIVKCMFEEMNIAHPIYWRCNELRIIC